ncbi:MAG: ribosome recycling factor [Deltaproteobacteria bacterium]|nr:ribosome recycling factor [Deltaproteobacteria bacterium]
MVQDVLKELQASFEKGIDAFKRELSKVRTGRANIALLDGVKVEYYGTMTPVSQVATLNVPDPRLITIKPWEKSLIPTIERAIKAQSDLGLNPASDGDIVRIPIPPLTQERRKELVKVIKKMSEEAKVGLRSSRREANDTLKEFVDAGEISEDDQKTGLKKVQELTDKFVAMVDEISGKKEKEIMEI